MVDCSLKMLDFFGKGLYNFEYLFDFPVSLSKSYLNLGTKISAKIRPNRKIVGVIKILLMVHFLGHPAVLLLDTYDFILNHQIKLNLSLIEHLESI